MGSPAALTDTMAAPTQAPPQWEQLQPRRATGRGPAAGTPAAPSQHHGPMMTGPAAAVGRESCRLRPVPVARGHLRAPRPPSRRLGSRLSALRLAMRGPPHGGALICRTMLFEGQQPIADRPRGAGGQSAIWRGTGRDRTAPVARTADEATGRWRQERSAMGGRDRQTLRNRDALHRRAPRRVARAMHPGIGRRDRSRSAIQVPKAARPGFSTVFCGPPADSICHSVWLADSRPARQRQLVGSGIDLTVRWCWIA